MVAPVVVAGLWMAIGTAGRRAAKKYGFLIARKKFPQLFKQVPKKTPKKPDAKKTTPKKKPSTEKKKPAQTLSNEQVAKYLDLQRRAPNAYKKVPEWIRTIVKNRSAQVREQQGAAYQRGQKMKPGSEIRPKGRKIQGGNKKAPDSAADKKEQLSKPRSKPKATTAKERKGKTKKVAPKKKLTAAQKEEMKADILGDMHDLIQTHRGVTGGRSIPEEDKIHEREMGKLRSKLKKLK